MPPRQNKTKTEKADPQATKTVKCRGDYYIFPSKAFGVFNFFCNFASTKLAKWQGGS